MKQRLTEERYPAFVVEIEKSESRFSDVDAIIDYLRQQVEIDPVARYIAVFDHYAHTTSLPEGRVAEEILAAKTIIFCFGITLPDPSVLALRPRSIGVAELTDRFVISFLEAPMPIANVTMEGWVRAIRNNASPQAKAS